MRTNGGSNPVHDYFSVPLREVSFDSILDRVGPIYAITLTDEDFAGVVFSISGIAFPLFHDGFFDFLDGTDFFFFFQLSVFIPV